MNFLVVCVCGWATRGPSETRVAHWGAAHLAEGCEGSDHVLAISREGR